MLRRFMVLPKCVLEASGVDCPGTGVKDGQGRSFNPARYPHSADLGLAQPVAGVAHNACSKRFSAEYERRLTEHNAKLAAAGPAAHRTRAAAQAAQPLEPRTVQKRAHAPETSQLLAAAGLHAAAGDAGEQATAGGDGLPFGRGQRANQQQQAASELECARRGTEEALAGAEAMELDVENTPGGIICLDYATLKWRSSS